MRCENKPLLQDDPRFFQDIASTAVEVGLMRASSSATVQPTAMTTFGFAFSLRRVFMISIFA
jgi:hypothetical protein